MTDIHGLVAQITLVLVVLVGAWTILLAVRGRPLPTMLTGALVWVVLLLVATSLLGAIQASTGRPPGDPLHLVYGALATAVLPSAWLIARSGGEPRRTVRVLAIASVVLLILVFRLFQTGG